MSVVNEQANFGKEEDLKRLARVCCKTETQANGMGKDERCVGKAKRAAGVDLFATNNGFPLWETRQDRTSLAPHVMKM